MKNAFLSIILFIALVSCEKEMQAVNHFDDDTVATIARLQDERSSDSLAGYFASKKATYRHQSVLAFASIQDSTRAQDIGLLLEHDPDPQVRVAAAFALGQIPCLASEKILSRALTLNQHLPVKQAIIEAYGKVARTWDIGHMEDSLLSAVGWSIYRMGVRGLSTPSLNKKAGLLLQSGDYQARLAAAHYFARGGVGFDSLSGVIIQAATLDSTDVRMAATLALKKINTTQVLSVLRNILKKDKDYRIRVNAARALEAFPFAQTKSALLDALSDSISHVGIAAAEAISKSISRNGLNEVIKSARSHQHWRIQATLYDAALSISNDKALVDETISLFKKSQNDYQRAALLTALRHSVESQTLLLDQALTSTVPVIKVSAATSLAEMNDHPRFQPAMRKTFADFFKRLIIDGDPAVIGVVSEVLKDSTLNYKSVITDIAFLKEALAGLSLPRDFEAVGPLKSAIAYFENVKYEPPANAFNHAVAWDTIKMIPQHQEAVIQTEKGNITIRLLVEEAPGSVMNFISLASRGFYNNKNFHRVVPNFVVQGGCPRGDGWGSLDYSIRSEFSLRRYTTGSIGMASAGKDTEGTQWFITHSPTPHLDGRYTIFAEVVDGMDVVHRMEVGDRIISVDLPGFQIKL